MASNTLQNYEQLSYGSPSGSMWRGQCRQVISDAVATRTLLANEAGAWCAFDSAAGVIYTLPTPVAGMSFTFFTTVTRTSNAHRFNTNAATQFLLGGVAEMNSAAATGEFFAANGTSHTILSMNGTTTGGIIGDRITVTAISSTVWFVDGVCNQTGTAATPFA